MLESLFHLGPSPLALILPTLLDDVIAWVGGHPGVLAALAFGSVGLFVGTLLAVPLLIAKMRPDHFMRRDPPRERFLGRHPLVRFTGRAAKNLLGLVLLLMGIAMLLLPGQGILTILIALSLLDFPGKRRLELRLVRQRHVRRSIAWIRDKAQQPPLLLPEEALADISSSCGERQVDDEGSSDPRQAVSIMHASSDQ